MGVVMGVASWISAGTFVSERGQVQKLNIMESAGKRRRSRTRSVDYAGHENSLINDVRHQLVHKLCVSTPRLYFHVLVHLKCVFSLILLIVSGPP